MMKQNVQFEQGFQDGWYARERGFTCDFMRRHKDGAILNAYSRVPVLPSEVDFAKGHIAGWEKACNELD